MHIFRAAKPISLLQTRILQLQNCAAATLEGLQRPSMTVLRLLSDGLNVSVERYSSQRGYQRGYYTVRKKKRRKKKNSSAHLQLQIRFCCSKRVLWQRQNFAAAILKLLQMVLRLLSDGLNVPVQRYSSESVDRSTHRHPL